MLNKAILGRIRPQPRSPLPVFPVELVAIDIDGTLLRNDKQVSEATLDAIHRTVQRGVRVVLATARPPRSCRMIYEQLGIDTPSIHYNGALVCEAPGGKPLHHRPVPAGLARQLVALSRRLDPLVAINVEILDRWYTDTVDPQTLDLVDGVARTDLFGPLRTCLNNAVTKLMFIAEPARLRPIEAAIVTEHGDHVAFSASDSNVLQVVHPMADKGHALREVAAMLGVPQQRVMAIGDAPNDVGMLEWAGLGVAMQNAWGEVIATADVTAPSNEDDGVAFALQRYVLRR